MQVQEHIYKLTQVKMAKKKLTEEVVEESEDELAIMKRMIEKSF